MDYPSNYQTTVIDSLHTLYIKIASFLPNLVAAIIVLILGWIIGSFLGKLVQKGLEAIKIDMAANQLGLGSLGEKTGKKLSISGFGGWLVKWFFFIGSFIAAADILNLTEVTNFLYQDVLAYAGHVIVAMAVLLLGILAANFFSDIVGSSVRASGIAAAGALASFTKWSILIFSVIAALSQLQIATSFLQDLFKAIVAMAAIAGGIAFGLGGKDHAKKVLDSVEEGLNRKI
jgi:hypothetical protein